MSSTSSVASRTKMSLRALAYPQMMLGVARCTSTNPTLRSLIIPGSKVTNTNPVSSVIARTKQPPYLFQETPTLMEANYQHKDKRFRLSQYCSNSLSPPNRPPQPGSEDASHNVYHTSYPIRKVYIRVKDKTSEASFNYHPHHETYQAHRGSLDYWPHLVLTFPFASRSFAKASRAINFQVMRAMAGL